MKQSLLNDSIVSSKHGTSAQSLLCGARRSKKKQRAIAATGSEASLTYEEVHLYYPRANVKRPVVLIGPTNIGRHELRQRIMLDTERFAAAVPHTSRSRRDGEMDGVDYHFISRSEFELHIKQGTVELLCVHFDTIDYNLRFVQQANLWNTDNTRATTTALRSARSRRSFKAARFVCSICTCTVFTFSDKDRPVSQSEPGLIAFFRYPSLSKRGCATLIVRLSH
jgi:hypothetical protein